MTKKSILAAVTVSALTLSQLGIVSADEVDVVDPTASSEIIVSEDTTGQSSGDIVSPTVPSDTETPIIDDSSNSSTPSTGEVTVDNPTVPGISEENPSDPGSEMTEPEIPTETDKPSTEQAGTVDVPTTDGGKATVVPDTSVPTNNPNITAETAQNAGASQVGTTSTVTGQVVRDVTRSNPVTLYNGASLVDIRDGLVTLSSGEKVTPESVGVTANADGTYTAKTIQGDMVTLPHTGEKNTAGLSAIGFFLMSLLGVASWRKHQKHKI
ncbi:LPXTG cell wall anchor domain-containing protein [Streptococcus gallolyticus subsp. gallolyticus]|uniref:LPXTG cell wall anchor domain-containing protein n=1 Tax=Streptococcus gallolyticus TaxID=315405 RepID=UPI0022848659|nr:LPXTG cell wall anchor domain-containing protein [Streptococcus gallolyticus]MCY7178387.1 LPXTG cell wall anchor domain-containing protein [Streptococcus gallolyticus subsp. gallolyticus]